MVKQLLVRSKINRVLYWLLPIFLAVSLFSFIGEKTGFKKPDRLQAKRISSSVRKAAVRPFDNDPIRFTLRANKQRVALGDEVTLTITAHYLNISPALLFVREGANAFRLKLLLPDGFVQTGGDYSDYMGTELSVAKPTVTYTLKGHFTKAGPGTAFRLLRGHANADASSLFIEKAQSTIQIDEAVTVQQKAKGAREGALNFQIVSYDCNSGVLQYQFTSSDGSPVNVTLPGIFGGTMNPNSVVSYVFPGDAKVGPEP